MDVFVVLEYVEQAYDILVIRASEQLDLPDDATGVDARIVLPYRLDRVIFARGSFDASSHGSMLTGSDDARIDMIPFLDVDVTPSAE